MRGENGEKRLAPSNRVFHKKFARILEFYAKRPQLQERLTEQVVGFLTDKLSPLGAMVVVDPAREYNAVREARRMGLVVIGLLDTDCDPTRIEEVWGESLATGFEKGGRTRQDLEVSPTISVAIDGNLESARHLVQASLLLYLGGMGSKEKNFYVDLSDRFGYGEEARRVQSLYLDGKREEAYAAVPDELVGATSLIGTEAEIIRAEMVFFETLNGGAVFSTGSIAWAGSLSHNSYDNNVARISGNVIRRFLDPAPFSG